jgi:hypothetical protein
MSLRATASAPFLSPGNDLNARAQLATPTPTHRSVQQKNPNLSPSPCPRSHTQSIPAMPQTLGPLKDIARRNRETLPYNLSDKTLLPRGDIYHHASARRSLVTREKRSYCMCSITDQHRASFILTPNITQRIQRERRTGLPYPGKTLPGKESRPSQTSPKK